MTNGLGGYASGTIAGQLNRRYHGLLVAALEPPLGSRPLLAKLNETASYAGQDYPLYNDQWANGEEAPGGFRYLERFYLKVTISVRSGCPPARWNRPGRGRSWISAPCTC